MEDKTHEIQADVKMQENTLQTHKRQLRNLEAETAQEMPKGCEQRRPKPLRTNWGIDNETLDGSEACLKEARVRLEVRLRDAGCGRRCG